MIRIQWEQTDWKHALISLFTFFVITIHHTWGKLLIFRKKLLLGWLSTYFSYHHSPCRLLLALFTKSVTIWFVYIIFLYYHTLYGYPFSYYHQTAHCCSSVRSIAKHDKEHDGWCIEVISKLKQRNVRIDLYEEIWWKGKYKMGKTWFQVPQPAYGHN
jgi:hypothetical protein